MNPPAAEVAADPAAVELLGDGKHGAGAAEQIRYEIALARRGLYDTLQQSLGLLGGEAAVLGTVSGLQHGDSPHIVHGALIGLAVHHSAVCALCVDDCSLLLVPLACQLLYFPFRPLLELWLELVRRPFA